MSENDALKLAVSGNNSGFDALYKLYHPKILRKCKRRLKDVEEAEDLTQEIFMKVYSQLKHFKHNSSFSTWLFTIVETQIASTFRAKNARPKFVVTEDYDKLLNTRTSIPTQLLSCQLQQAIDLLNEKDKRYLELEFEGRKCTEIGKILGRTKSTVISNLGRIHETLKLQLA